MASDAAPAAMIEVILDCLNMICLPPEKLERLLR
jgi:hypothetical protein